MAFKKLRRRHVAAAAVGVAALTVPAAANATGGAATQPAGIAHHGQACNPWERLGTLAVEQKRVLKLLKGFEVLRNQADLTRMGQLDPKTGTQFAALPHMYDSMQGIGMTIVNVGNQGPGMPTLVFYRPNPRAKNVVQPFVPNFPYRLVGWGYVSPYTPGKAPAYPSDPGLRCIKPSDSFIHERSVHPSDTWQNITVPPKEDWKGQLADDTAPTAAECDCVVGLSHGRFWDTHLFLTGTPFPQVSMFNPGRRIPGFDPVVGKGFFFPAKPAA